MSEAVAPQFALVLAPDPSPEPAYEAEAPLPRLLDCGGEALTDAEVLAVLLDEAAPRRASELLDRAGGFSGLPALEGLLAAGPCDPDLAPLAPRASLLGGGLGPSSRAPRPEPAGAGRLLPAPAVRPRRAGSHGRPLSRPAPPAARGLRVLPRHDQPGIGRALGHPAGRLRREAFAVLLFQTHPSGDPSPSREDIAFTRRFAKAGEVAGVELVDHMIVGNGGRWVALKARGGW